MRRQNHQCVTWSVSRGSDDTSLRSREQSACSACSRAAGWKRERRQLQSTISVSWSHHERWTLPQGMDQETASGVAVLRRERAVHHSQNCIRRGIQSVAKDLEISCGWHLHVAASAMMCLVTPKRTGHSEARRHAESVDTGGIQVKEVRREGRHEREPSRLDDQTAAETEY